MTFSPHRRFVLTLENLDFEQMKAVYQSFSQAYPHQVGHLFYRPSPQGEIVDEVGFLTALTQAVTIQQKQLNQLKSHKPILLANHTPYSLLQHISPSSALWKICHQAIKAFSLKPDVLVWRLPQSHSKTDLTQLERIKSKHPQALILRDLPKEQLDLDWLLQRCQSLFNEADFL